MTSKSPLVLVDASVWIPFLRNAASKEVAPLDDLLSLSSAATCAPIRVEVVSGAPNQKEFKRLRELFSAITELPVPEGIWGQIEESRFLLSRKGYQVSLIDLMIALTAKTHEVPIWTLDNDFYRIEEVVPFDRYKS